MSPAALGLSLSSQGMHLEATTSGGIGMGPTISGLGMSSLGLSGIGLGSSSARTDDEERRRRLESVIAALGGRQGRVGEEGVERVCRRNGWAVLWEDRRGGGRRLTGAGTNVLVDVDFKGRDAVEKVTATVHEAGDGAKGTIEQAGKVLLADLKESKSSLDKKLDRFAANLEKLARLDKLSHTQEGLNCYDAIAGVYTSLQRLYEHQFKVAAEFFKEKSEAVGRAEWEVICKKSGRPRMHSRRTIGLSLDYWQSRVDEGLSKAGTKAIRPRRGSTMDIESSQDALEVNRSGGDRGLFSLTIETEPSPAALYPSVRTSDHWISDAIEKRPEENPTDLDQLLTAAPNQPVIEWQEPPPMYLTSTSTGVTGENADAMALDPVAGNLGKLPDVRFSAKLNPPIVLPLPLAVQVLNQVEMSIPQETIRPTSFESLVLNRTDASPYDANSAMDGETKTSIIEKSIIVPSSVNNEEVETKHSYSLSVPKSTVYGRLLEELPFSHPRQIIQLLPTLRQYAFLGGLIQSALASSTPPTAPLHEPSNLNGLSQPTPDDLDFISNLNSPNGTHDGHVSAALDVLLSQDSTISSMTVMDTALSALPINISLTLTPSPSLIVAFSTKDSRPATVTVDILPNAEVAVVAQNLVPDSADAIMEGENQDAETRRMRRVQRIAHALETAGDLGIWVEWMRERFTNG